MGFLLKKNNVLLGIDISTAAIKLLELSRQSNRFRVESFSVAPLPQEAVIDKNIANVDVVADAIRQAVKNSGTKLKSACVAVAGSSVMTKVITMPTNLDDADMYEQVMIEADQYVPYNLDEVNLDYEIQGTSAKQDGMIDVLLVASRRENVEDRAAALEKAGLKAEIVDVEAFAMEKAFSLLTSQFDRANSDGTFAVVDVGATITTLNVLHDGKTIYTREQGFGGRQLTEEVQRRYGLSYEEAGLAKRHGGLPDNYLTDILEPFKRAMVQQIARSLQFFVSSSANRTVDQIVLAGGCASIHGISQLVEQSLALPVTIANPFVNMSLASRIRPQSLGNDASAMMIACGLALRSFD